jgi:hypothetical protein
VKTAIVLWLAVSAVLGWRDAERSAIEGDDRPWWGRAIMALIAGAVFSAVPGTLAVLAGLP